MLGGSDTSAKESRAKGTKCRRTSPHGNRSVSVSLSSILQHISVSSMGLESPLVPKMHRSGVPHFNLLFILPGRLLPVLYLASMIESISSGLNIS